MNRDMRSHQIRRLILSKLLPTSAIGWLLSSYSFLMLSAIGFVYSYQEEWIDKSLFLIGLATITCIVCMHTIIGGIFLFAHKNPYLNEWKERLGYHEK